MPEFTVEARGIAIPAIGFGCNVEVGAQGMDYIALITVPELPQLPPTPRMLPCDGGACDYSIMYHDGDSALSSQGLSATRPRPVRQYGGVFSSLRSGTHIGGCPLSATCGHDPG